jgi:hypothetical protein
MLTEKQAAELVHKSEGWLRQLRLYGDESRRPPVHYAGRTPLYDAEEFITWIKSPSNDEPHDTKEGQ